MKQLMCVLLVMSFGLSAFAKNDIVVIQKGETAQFDGYLIKPEMEEYFNDLYEDNKIYEHQLKKQAEIIKLHEDKDYYNKIQLQLAQDNYKALEKQSKAQSWQDKLTYFAVGALAVVIFQATRH